MAIMHPGTIVYFECKYVPTEEAKISVMTHAFNYGTGIFEGIRGYYNAEEDNILVFRLKEHVDRMVRNSKVLCMDISVDAATIENVCLELIRRSEFREVVYIRAIIYKSELSSADREGCRSSMVLRHQLGDYCDITSGLDVAVVLRRLSDNAIPTRLNHRQLYQLLLAASDKMSGFSEAIFLRENGTVAEGSAMNLFMVHQGKLITTPVNADILVGITRNTVLELARDVLHLEVVERDIARTELYVCDELFFTGTGAHGAVRSVDKRIVGSANLAPSPCRCSPCTLRARCPITGTGVWRSTMHRSVHESIAENMRPGASPWPFLLNLAAILLLTRGCPAHADHGNAGRRGQFVQQNTITSRVYESGGS